MKKYIHALLACLLISTAIFPVAAEDAPFATAYDLYSYWEENDAYPDYVCGVWSTDGGIANLTFGVLDTAEGNAGKEEILALIANDRGVSFAYGVNSYNRLQAVMRELDPFFKSDRGLVSAGPDVKTGTIMLGILEEKAGDPETLAMLEEMRNTFGDIFSIEYTGAIDLTLEQTPIVTIGASSEPRGYFVYALVGILILTLTAAAVMKARRKSVLMTNTGETVTSDARPTVSQTKRAVKEAVVTAPESLDKKVFDAIGK